METKAAKHILTAPENEPYPEKLENLLTIEEAAEIWKTPAVTIRKKCKEGFFGKFARKMGGQWIIAPEAMFIWKGSTKTNDYISNPYWSYSKIKSAFKILETRNEISRDNLITLALLKLYDALNETCPKADTKDIKEPTLHS